MTLDQFKGLAGELARPWVLWAGGLSASVATVMCAWEPSFEGAAVVAAAWAGVFGIYWGKAQEVAKIEAAKISRSPLVLADAEEEAMPWPPR